ncbi:MAG: amidohydrolase [Gammaproteobacteria bacterium]|nr:amidohydrolase [Gammaproteobacteria bacterium]
MDIPRPCAHGAHPDHSVDPVVVAAQLVTALQSVVSRNVRPTEAAVVSVTRVQAGDAYNVIPASGRLSGTARSFSTKVMELVETRMTELAHAVAAGFGATAEVDFRTVFHPVVNDAAAALGAGEGCDELVGETRVRRGLPAAMGSEDFSFMLEEVPGCYLLIGNADGTHQRPVHNPGYDFNDAALPYGASFFARVVEKQLAP